MNLQTYLIIDFDSTIVKVESLDLLADIVLREKENREEIVNKIKAITLLGMEGKLDFGESLESRVNLFSPTQKDITKLVQLLKETITDSVLKNSSFFQNNSANIYIISGGFKEFIIPIAEQLGIAKDHVLANDFIWDEEKSLGFEKSNLLSQKGGKVKAVRQLALDGKIIVIGDGFTDYEIKREGEAELFIAYVEHAKRENVIKNADFVAKDFNQVIEYIN
jgi:D-3-phosphoglycerate dehydrogenase / 2-oxoglutarate reductase